MVAGGKDDRQDRQNTKKVCVQNKAAGQPQYSRWRKKNRWLLSRGEAMENVWTRPNAAGIDKKQVCA